MRDLHAQAANQTLERASRASKPEHPGDDARRIERERFTEVDRWGFGLRAAPT